MAESNQSTRLMASTENNSTAQVILEESLSQTTPSMLQQHVQHVDIESTSTNRLVQPTLPNRQSKKSSFQITSVTVGSRLSNDGGEDSADDLDESHTDDLSSDMLDVSKVTDYDYSSEEAAVAVSASTIASVDNVASALHQQQVLTTNNNLSSIAGSSSASNVSVTVVESPNLPLSVVQHPEIQWQNRFRVVKIETSEPFRRGRWLCMDFLDPPPASSSSTQQSGEQPIGGGCGGERGERGNSGSGGNSSSGTGSMQHGDSLVMDSASATLMQHHPAMAAMWSADLNASCAGYAGPEVTHGLTEMTSGVYPMSIILQTQQQGGNLDFTNTALHMTAKMSHPPNPNTNLNPTTHQAHQQLTHQASPGCSDYVVQQQQTEFQSHGVGVPQVHLVQPTTMAITNTTAVPPQSAVIHHMVQVDNTIQQQQQQSIQVNQTSANQQQQQPNNAMTSRQLTERDQPQQPTLPSQAASIVACNDQPNVIATSVQPQEVTSAVNVQSSTSSHPNGQSSQQSNTSGSGASVTTDSATTSVISNVAGVSQETTTTAAATAPTGEEGDSESASGASTVAIDNKIEQAMDLVKSHLMFAVREEVDVLKERITELMDRIGQLEYENGVLRASATPECLAKLAQSQNQNSTT